MTFSSMSLTGNVILTKGFGVLLFTGILLVCSLIAGAKTF